MMLEFAPGPALMSGVPAGRVRVLAPDPMDRSALVPLLERAGLGIEHVDPVGPHGVAEGDDAPLAVVVCHRAGGPVLVELVRACAMRGVRVIVFTDCDEESVIVDALDAGARQVFRADESDRVMVARLAAALRQPVSRRLETLSIAPFAFDLARRQVRLWGADLDLSPREFDLAYYLFEHRGRVVTNAELLTSVWSLPQTIDSRRIDTAVCRVRRKMHLGSDSGWVLRRFRREGYGLYQDSRDVSRGPAEAVPTSEPERRGVAIESEEEDMELDAPLLD